ncbi:hypothetical protein ElyMa_006027600 [Elysia marginata]|uniref:Uncharacterized protein n=1 Tax=Elysia marginata TaxID=1093978 RepID=A0AAV4GI78_9GAST|nr:hypothetical protein ElyMa_006027600 [Elysia marginata]
MTSAWAHRWLWGRAGSIAEGFLVYFLGLSSMYILMAIAVDSFDDVDDGHDECGYFDVDGDDDSGYFDVERHDECGYFDVDGDDDSGYFDDDGDDVRDSNGGVMVVMVGVMVMGMVVGMMVRVVVGIMTMMVSTVIMVVMMLVVMGGDSDDEDVVVVTGEYHPGNCEDGDEGDDVSAILITCTINKRFISLF